jgi:hypothetical protein
VTPFELTLGPTVLFAASAALQFVVFFGNGLALAWGGVGDHNLSSSTPSSNQHSVAVSQSIALHLSAGQVSVSPSAKMEGLVSCERYR